jgi:UDP-2,4-diacetamido-2,4,6-trideoxy-beta-L-altropyranose hydrolase
MRQLSILFRVDASPLMGMGHLMRCRAIAEAVVHCGGVAIFAMVEPIPTAIAMMINIPAHLVCLPGPSSGLEDLNGLKNLIYLHNPVITVIDGYHLTDDYHRAIRRQSPLAVLWDLADRMAISANVIIDSSPNAPIQSYAKIAPEALLLTGPRYALIRKDISQVAKEVGIPLEQRKQLLVTFGGSDPLNLSMSVLPELASSLSPDIGINILLGGAYSHAIDLQNLAARYTNRAPITVIIDPPSVAPVFASAGLVISAAGGTIGELVAMGLPALSVVVAKNQVASSQNGPYPCIDGCSPNSAVLIAERAVLLWQDLPERKRLANSVRGLVDGRGAMRVANTLLSKQF